MSTMTLTTPLSLTLAGANLRPGLSRLVGVELRKMINTRAGFWLQVATVAITVVAVIVRSVVGDAADHTFAEVLNIAVRPAAFLLPVAGILLVTSEWSQRTGMITFTLVPQRSRVLGTKLIASTILALAIVAVSVTAAAAAVLITSPGVDGTWAHLAPLIAQSALYLTTGMIIGVAFGAILLASTPAIVVLSTLPIAWAALASLSYFDKVAPWLDTSRALDQLPHEVFNATQWAHAATALALWMLLPLAIGTWRITRREVAS
jgi:ABC-2 type transport system permease protein